jgi:NAD(P)-dependent dehydrogenase (short-subunit alcohol dehydrogenase family)
MRVQGKAVLVTGAASGIGEALALKLAHRGAKLVLADLEEAALEGLCAKIAESGGVAMARGCDLLDEAKVRWLVSEAVEAYGTLDILINNAGITLGGDIRLFTDEDWERVLGVNLWGPIRMVQAVLPHMVERGSGYIVNVASAVGLVAPGLWIPYATSKFALVGYSEGLCSALRSKGIGVSVVCPMWVQTDLLKGPAPKLMEKEARPPSKADVGVGRWWQRFVQRMPGRQMTPDTAAGRIIRGIERERFLVYTHQWLRLIVLARALAPQTFSRVWGWANAADEKRYRLGQGN